MASRVVLAVDHGTSGIKSSLVDVEGRVLATASRDTPLVHTPDGGVEQDAELWWQALVDTGRELIDRGVVPPDRVVAVCVSSTFSSTVAVGRDGRPLMNAITWMDSRGAPHVRRLMSGWPRLMGYGAGRALSWIRRTGGAPTLSGKDDLAHALWIQHDRPEIYRQTDKLLPSKDYLNLRLCGRAAATYDSIQLFWLTDTRDVGRIAYDPELVRRSGLDRDRLPELVPSTSVLGALQPEVADALGLGRDVVVVAGSPDHQAAAVGAGAVADFDGHLYVGTSSWVQCTVPFKKTDVWHSIASLPTAIPGRYYCANEQDLAGGCLGFLLHNVLFHPNALDRSPAPAASYELLDAIAAGVPAGSRGLLFTPWLNGERTPVDDATLRGGLFNLGTASTQDDIVRAVLEGVALNTRWSLGHVERFVGRPFPQLRFVGGGAVSDVWCQIFADVTDREIHRVVQPREANARGAALIAAVALGDARFEDIPGRVAIERRFVPDPTHRKLYDELFSIFVRLYRSQRRIYRDLNRERLA